MFLKITESLQTVPTGVVFTIETDVRIKSDEIFLIPEMVGPNKSEEIDTVDFKG